MMDQHYFLLLCVASITLIGCGRSEAAAAAAPAGAQPTTDEVLNKLFMCIDKNNDGIITLNELEQAENSAELREIITDNDQRKKLIDLLKGACGIDIVTFKRLFKEHFVRQYIPEQLRTLYSGKLQYLSGAAAGYLTSLLSQAPAPSNANK